MTRSLELALAPFEVAGAAQGAFGVEFEEAGVGASAGGFGTFLAVVVAQEPALGGAGQVGGGIPFVEVAGGGGDGQGDVGGNPVGFDGAGGFSSGDGEVVLGEDSAEVADAVGLLVPGLDPAVAVVVEDDLLSFDLGIDLEAARAVAPSLAAALEFHGVAAVGGALLHAAAGITVAVGAAEEDFVGEKLKAVGVAVGVILGVRQAMIRHLPTGEGGRAGGILGALVDGVVVLGAHSLVVSVLGAVDGGDAVLGAFAVGSGELGAGDAGVERAAVLPVCLHGAVGIEALASADAPDGEFALGVRRVVVRAARGHVPPAVVVPVATTGGQGDLVQLAGEAAGARAVGAQGVEFVGLAQGGPDLGEQGHGDFIGAGGQVDGVVGAAAGDLLGHGDEIVSGQLTTEGRHPHLGEHSTQVAPLVALRGTEAAGGAVVAGTGGVVMAEDDLVVAVGGVGYGPGFFIVCEGVAHGHVVAVVVLGAGKAPAAGDAVAAEVGSGNGVGAFEVGHQPVGKFEFDLGVRRLLHAQEGAVFGVADGSLVGAVLAVGEVVKVVHGAIGGHVHEASTVGGGKVAVGPALGVHTAHAGGWQGGVESAEVQLPAQPGIAVGIGEGELGLLVACSAAAAGAEHLVAFPGVGVVDRLDLVAQERPHFVALADGDAHGEVAGGGVHHIDVAAGHEGGVGSDAARGNGRGVGGLGGGVIDFGVVVGGRGLLGFLGLDSEAHHVGLTAQSLGIGHGGGK